MQRREQRRKLCLHPAEPARQPFRRGVRARDRQPQHACQSQQHDGIAGRPAREQAVEPPVARGVFGRAVSHARMADGLGPAHIVCGVCRRCRVRQLLRRRRDGVERVEQGGERFLFSCRHAHDRHAELRLQLRQVDGDALASRLVEQVHANDQVRRHAAHLQREHERALQARRVAYDDHGVGLAAAHKVARDCLLR